VCVLYLLIAFYGIYTSLLNNIFLVYLNKILFKKICDVPYFSFNYLLRLSLQHCIYFAILEAQDVFG